MKYLLSLLSIFFVIFLYSCIKEKGLLIENQINICDSLSVTYSVTIAPIIATKCAIPGCHVPGGAGNGYFTSYAGVKAKVDNNSFENRIFITGDMPPGGLPDDEKQKIQCWLDAGAPNN